jgi:hypothetical protein
MKMRKLDLKTTKEAAGILSLTAFVIAFFIFLAYLQSNAANLDEQPVDPQVADFRAMMFKQLDQLVMAHQYTQRCDVDGHIVNFIGPDVFPCFTAGRWNVVQSRNVYHHWFFEKIDGQMVRKSRLAYNPDDKAFLDFEEINKSL